MPTYEYVCEGCDHRFEELQSFSEEALTKCPVCKKKKLRRLFGTGAAVLFKGSGFYETDYNRSDSYKQAAKAESEAAKPVDKKDSTTDSGGASGAKSPPSGGSEGGKSKKSPKSEA